MGRNFPSATDLVHQVVSDLKPLSEVLSPQDRLVFNRFTEHILNNRAAIANAAALLPMEAALLILLLEEHKRNRRVYDELCAEIEGLKKAIGELTGLAHTG